MGKKNNRDNEFVTSSVLSKPQSQEEKERVYKEKSNKKTKTILTALAIVVIAAGLTAFILICKPLTMLKNLMPASPAKVIQTYMTACNNRDYELLKSCLSEEMCESVETIKENLGNSDAIFSNMFTSELKEKFGDDLRFEVANIKSNPVLLSNGTYLGIDYQNIYGADKVDYLTCDIISTGSKDSASNTSIIVMIHVDGKWKINNMIAGNNSDDTTSSQSVNYNSETENVVQ